MSVYYEEKYRVSIEEEVAEHDEIALGGEYVAYDDDDDGNDGGDGEGDEDDDNDENGKERNDGSSGDDDDEEIQEDEEDAAQTQPQSQPHPKKKVPNAPSARHIPPTHLHLTRLPGGKSRGKPKYGGKVLFGYDSSWARTIYETIDHKNATRLFRHQSSYAKMKKWPMEGECARVRDIVENSGSDASIQNSVIAYDKAAISCFTERFYGEVDAFQFPFGEMALIPEDAEQILELQVEGKSTGYKFKKNLDWKKIYELTEKLFGWDEKTTYDLFVKGKKYPKKEFKLKEIRKMHAGSLEKDGDNELLSEKEVRATAAAYLLYVLASVIFPDSKGNRVSINLLQLLDPLEEVSKYSWGTAIIAHLNAQLANASRERTSQMNGNLSLLQVWIYEHFPSLIKDDGDIQLEPTWNNTKPRGTRYKYSGSQDKEETQKLKLLAMRQKLDNMTGKEVNFDPYKEDRVGGLIDLAYYHGPLFYPYGYSMNNPNRVMHQLGYIQDSPD
ncbi:protein MAINTENANCE OF MERISTEMS-like [Papaver somniferum]|uniref:protein MAINTENANCE OF MERISTEMS-like n=1 Tax=Papaver somniferum TaxID=3469 RepID=UPI000E70400F|nr:protein MAINTENANCE OF MERISTEMS-like [Papaver somniferum]